MAGRVQVFRSIHYEHTDEPTATRRRRGARAALRLAGVGLLLAVSATLALASNARAATPVLLGTADSFAILGGSTVTNTGPSVIVGDLGLSPGLSVTGFPPGLLFGVQHAGDGVALQAKNDLVTAYNDAAGQGPPNAVTADLGGQTLTPGVYNSASSLALTGALTLDAEGDEDAVFIFQAGSTLTTASASVVNLIGGAQACNVFWQVGSSATLGTNSVFRGTILALTSISLTTGARVEGRVLARDGAVTLDTNLITVSECETSAVTPPVTPPPVTPPPDTPPVTPPPDTPPVTPPPDTPPVTPPDTTPGTTAPADVTGPSVNLTTGKKGKGVKAGGASSGTICVARNFTARVVVRDRSGVRRVDVYLDGKRIERTTRKRFSIHIKAAAMGTGHHVIRVVARDRLGNRTVRRWSFTRCSQSADSPQYTG